MNQYRLLSFNIRTQTTYDKDQQIIYRVDFLCDTIRALQADVIGLQEMTPLMRGLMIERLPEFVFLGGGRDKDRLGESAGIAVRQSRFLIERVYSEMLSPTPEVPGSTYGGDQSGCPRVFTSCDLQPVEGGQAFRFMNIHTDHEGKNARRLEMEQLMRAYEEQQTLRPLPTVITGDLNATPDAPELAPLLADPRFRDASSGLGGTFHDYDRRAEAEKIDYVCLTQEWQVLRAQLLHEKRDGLFLSDHDPVVVDAGV